MAAAAGDDPADSRTGLGFFPGGTPFASDAGMQVLTGRRDPDRVRRDLVAAGYTGEPVALMIASDFPTLSALGLVAADMMRRCGMTVDQQMTDWGSIIQRRTSKAAPSQGGWNAFVSAFTGLDMSTPARSLALRGNGAGAWFGCPTAPKLEILHDRWFAAKGESSQKAIARDIQLQAFEDVPFLPLGSYFQSTVQQRSLTGTLRGLPLFWNVHRD